MVRLLLNRAGHLSSSSAEPDAGIVNFYQEKDTLMAHVDRSEVCATSPLVSISYVSYKRFCSAIIEIFPDSEIPLYF